MAWSGHDSVTVACVSQWRGPLVRRDDPDHRWPYCSGFSSIDVPSSVLADDTTS
jgi:hypothetical protein